MARQNTANTQQTSNKSVLRMTGYDLQKVYWGKDNKYCKFTLALPIGISLYGCTLMYTKEGKGFITPGQSKGKDGKWYNNYGLYLDPEMEQAIVAQLEGM